MVVVELVYLAEIRSCRVTSSNRCDGPFTNGTNPAYEILRQWFKQMTNTYKVIVDILRGNGFLPFDVSADDDVPAIQCEIDNCLARLGDIKETDDSQKIYEYMHSIKVLQSKLHDMTVNALNTAIKMTNNANDVCLSFHLVTV